LHCIQQARIADAQEEAPTGRRIEVARRLIDHCIATFPSHKGALSMIKAGYEQTFLYLDRQAATATEHQNTLSTMDWMLARDVREAEASNKRWVAKLNLEQSAASSQSAKTRAKAMLIQSKAVAAKRAELVADLMLVVRALEEQDTVYKTTQCNGNTADLLAKRTHSETKRNLILEEIKMVRTDLLFNQSQQLKYDVAKEEKKKIVEGLDVQLQSLSPKEAALNSKIMLKMQARMLLKLIKWHGDTRVRSVVWNWAEAVEAALLARHNRENSAPNEVPIQRRPSVNPALNKLPGFQRRPSVNPALDAPSKSRRSSIADLKAALKPR